MKINTPFRCSRSILIDLQFATKKINKYQQTCLIVGHVDEFVSQKNIEESDCLQSAGSKIVPLAMFDFVFEHWFVVYLC